MPPPPPPPGPPPPPAGGLPPARPGPSAGAPNRGALLQSIQRGRALKKTVTHDRSAPTVGGSAAGGDPPRGSPASASAGLGQASSASTSKLPGIGGLFADGMPKLKKTQGGVQTGRSGDISHSTTNLSSPTSSRFNSQAGTPSPNGTAGSRNYFNRSNSNAGIHQHNSFSSSSLLYSSRSMSDEKYNFFFSSGDFLNTRAKLNQTLNNNNSFDTLNREKGVPEGNELGPKPRPSLGRSPSISKLVHNFESIELEEDLFRRNCADIASGFRGSTQLGSSKPPAKPPKPPPPHTAKPILRHTVRRTNLLSWAGTGYDVTGRRL